MCRSVPYGPVLIAMADMAEAPEVPTRRPNVMARVVAGIGVVVAALVPVAALVFLILHIVNAVTFT
jgi:hypothetical protein